MASTERIGAFVVKERIENLEKLINQIVEIDGLKDMAKDVTKKVLDEALESGKADIREAANSTIQEATKFIIDENKSMSDSVDKRLEYERAKTAVELATHLKTTEERVKRVENLLKIALTLFVLETILVAGLASLVS